MRSRLLTRLDGAIAKARNPVEVACLKAERACFLARQGQMAQARMLITALQSQFAWRPHAAVSAWLSLAEGLHDYYTHLGPSARDRVLRAHALSGAAHLAPLRALSAAWLAHMDVANHDMVRMAQHVHEALASAQADHHSARSRACLVVAYAYHFAGDERRALPWYARSRFHAAADGDEAHLSALMHNQASLRGSQARLAAMFGEGSADVTRQALMSTESITRFDAGIGAAALVSLVPMVQAQLLTHDQQWAEALAVYTQHYDAALSEGLERMKPCFLADMAWCRLQLGDAQQAQADARAAESSLRQPCDLDDRALAEARLAQVFDKLGEARTAAVLRERARSDLQAHRGEQERLVALLDEALKDIVPATA
ncbi:hypothetical protein V4F39_15095 [Aquincola sp. MAHUQ-54]|uniref:Uncharacterized protein n=1 Tax=Aquincola agrisoli TaxID=3119538 RepID=A0AAW9QEJ4_9BURK